MTQQPKNWFDRNWKWFIPTICLATIILFGGFFWALVFGVTKLLKSSDAYQQAVAAAKADPRVIAALGSPIKEAIFVAGNISVNSTSGRGSSGFANFAIRIHGPKGKATIYVVASKSGTVWKFSKLVVRMADTAEEFDLKEQSKTGERTEIFKLRLCETSSRLIPAGHGVFAQV